MPKRIAKKDSKKIYLAYKLGEDKNRSYYDDVFSVDCQFSVFNGDRETNHYGVMLQYNALAIIEHNEKTKSIDEFTKVWIRTKPEDSSDAQDFTVVKCGEVYDGLFPIYLQSKVPNVRHIWYEYKGKIYNADVNFDLDTFTVTTPNNMYLPLWYDMKIWYREPANNETTEYGMKLLEISNFSNFTRYIFEKGIYVKE